MVNHPSHREGHLPPDRPSGPVWTRPPQRKRERLTLDAIVTVTTQIADTEGLEAVSIRRVATALNARPMTLYSYVARKEDLIDLVTDRVLGEMLLDEVPPRWDDALRAIARRTREVAERHQWIIATITQRPRLGPNGLRHLEQSLAAVASLEVDKATATSLLRAIDSYTIGCGAIAFADRQMRARDQISDQEWRASTAAYFERLKDDPQLPRLAEFGADLLMQEDRWAEVFDTGLEWLLHGFRALIGDGDGSAHARTDNGADGAAAPPAGSGEGTERAPLVDR